jgi:fluoroquinolone resistance protein
MSFDARVYYQQTFSKLTLTDETIEGVSFEECKFEGCSFTTCKFISCKFVICKFSGCTLSAITPTNSRFSEVKFSGSKAIGFDWAKAARIDDLQFSDCQINYSNFGFLKTPKIKIINCEAKEVDFLEADMNNGVFTNTDFEKSRFFKTNLSGADFRGARNYFIDVQNNTIKKARFSLPEVLGLLKGLDIIIE